MSAKQRHEKTRKRRGVSCAGASQISLLWQMRKCTCRFLIASLRKRFGMEIIMHEKKQKIAAIVTGATSGSGLAICKRLYQEGYEILGVGRNFQKKEYLEANMKAPQFHEICCDIQNTEELLQRIKQEIKKNQLSLVLLVNNAGVGYFGRHEEIARQHILEMVRTNLEVPMLLTQYFLRELEKNQGNIIMISSVTAREDSPHGCAYGATKAGLSAFSKSLFAEVRKRGVRVTLIHPDMMKSDFYRSADFCEETGSDTCLVPEDVAQAVQDALHMRKGMVCTEIMLQPQRHQIHKKTAVSQDSHISD
jgi:short-subunit dehydrogenase